MNRFQHDNIDPDVTPAKRKAVLEKRSGINWMMSKARRAAKQARHRKNKAERGQS